MIHWVTFRYSTEGEQVPFMKPPYYTPCMKGVSLHFEVKQREITCC
jgi:hypothetical protein